MDERDTSTPNADTAHTGIFASVTRPFSPFLGGAWDKAMQTTPLKVPFILGRLKHAWDSDIALQSWQLVLSGILQVVKLAVKDE